MSRFLAVLMYGVLIVSAVLPRDVTQFWARAFGPFPFGVPVTWVVAGVLTAWYTPYWWVWWHVLAMKQARRLDTLSILNALFFEPEFKRSAMHVIGGFIYFITSAAVWIVYTAWRGI